MEQDGWVSIELLLVTLIVILTIPNIISIIDVRMDAVASTREIVDARVLGETIAETIETVYAGGEGHHILIKMPGSIDNMSYTVNVNSQGVFFRFNNMMGVSFLTPIMISNDPSGKYKPVVMHPDKSYEISNIKDQWGYNHVIIEDK